MAVKLIKNRVIFRKLNQVFTRLRNCDLRLKASDGEFSNDKEIAIGKRYGVSQYGGNITDDFPVRSQFIYEIKDGTKKHVVSHNTKLLLKNGNAWDDLKTGLTADKIWGAIAFDSYKGTGSTPKVVVPEDIKDSVSFTLQGTFTKINVSGTTNWTDDLLVGREVYPNTTTLPATKLTIVKNDASNIWVEGDWSAVATGTGTVKIVYPTVIFRLVDTSQNWTADTHAGKLVLITSGVGVGQMRVITGNTKDTLLIDLPWEKDPDSTSNYSIYTSTDKILYLGNGVDAMQRYDTTGTPTALTSVPKGNMFAEVQKRIVVAGDPANPYTAYYSDIADPEYFDPTFVIRPPGNDKITGLIAWDDRGIILKEKSLWLFDFVFNETTSVWEVKLKKIPSQSGCKSPRSVQVVGDQVWYFTGSEIHAIGASKDQFGAITTFDVGFPVTDLLSDVTAAEAVNAVAFSSDKKYYLSFPDRDVMVVYSTQYDVWLVWDNMLTYSFVADGDNVLIGRSTDNDAKVCQIEVKDQFNDIGEAITQTISISFDDGDPDNAKFMRFVDYNFENKAGSCRMKIKAVGHKRSNNIDKLFAIGHNLGSQGEFGPNEFGEEMFGGDDEGKLRDQIRKSVGLTGYLFLFDIINAEIDEDMILTGLKFWTVGTSIGHYSREFIH